MRRTTNLPRLTVNEIATLLVCGLLLVFAAWFTTNAVDRVADGTPSNAPEVSEP